MLVLGIPKQFHAVTSRLSLNGALVFLEHILKILHLRGPQSQTNDTDNHSSKVKDGDEESNSMRTGSPNFRPSSSAAPP